jgi:hypothetical protein
MKTKIKFLLLFLFVLLAAPQLWAQDAPKVEVSFILGWTFSDGVSGDPFLARDGNIYDTIEPKDSFSWGFTGEYFLTDQIEAGFLYDHQASKLEISGTANREIGDLSINTYQGIFSYNWGEGDSPARPFFILGLGATNYGSVDFTTSNGLSGTIDGNTKASFMVGGGFKLYASRNFGARLQVRWNPTYIKTDEEGWWCDPFWGCYVVGSAEYSNQFEFGGGASFRF